MLKIKLSNPSISSSKTSSPPKPSFQLSKAPQQQHFLPQLSHQQAHPTFSNLRKSWISITTDTYSITEFSSNSVQRLGWVRCCSWVLYKVPFVSWRKKRDSARMMGSLYILYSFVLFFAVWCVSPSIVRELRLLSARDDLLTFHCDGNFHLGTWQTEDCLKFISVFYLFVN